MPRDLTTSEAVMLLPTLGPLSCGSNILSEACANKISSSQLKWEYTEIQNICIFEMLIWILKKYILILMVDI